MSRSEEKEVEEPKFVPMTTCPVWRSRATGRMRGASDEEALQERRPKINWSVSSGD